MAGNRVVEALADAGQAEIADLRLRILAQIANRAAEVRRADEILGALVAAANAIELRLYGREQTRVQLAGVPVMTVAKSSLDDRPWDCAKIGGEIYDLIVRHGAMPIESVANFLQYEPRCVAYVVHRCKLLCVDVRWFVNLAG